MRSKMTAVYDKRYIKTVKLKCNLDRRIETTTTKRTTGHGQLIER